MQMAVKVGLQIYIENCFVVMEKVKNVRDLKDMNRTKTVALVVLKPKAFELNQHQNWMV